ncbi:hypothetical protein [Bartonella harrusi]|uniref:hypothetical protein n=1 Tax=Bartonella harrusi TaxID=2961895 RepID=UPI0035A93DC0
MGIGTPYDFSRLCGIFLCHQTFSGAPTLTLSIKRKKPTGIFKAEALAPTLGSFSGLGGLLAGNGPIQWALAPLMILAACAGFFCVTKRFQEHQL